MPKRKRDKNSDIDLNYLSKKIKKLERKLKHAKNRHKNKSDSSSADEIGRSPLNQIECNSPDVIHDELLDIILNDTGNGAAAATVAEGEALADVDAEPDEYIPSIQPLPLPGTLPDVNTAKTVANNAHPSTSCDLPVDVEVDELDEDLLEILGEDPSATKEFGKEIQKDLAVRLNHISTMGLSKESRKELREKYLVPVNCKSIKAPALNPEICASLVESQAKRDKGIENKQKFTACALSSLSEAITLVLSSEHKNPQLLKLLMDTARIMSDTQYLDSTTRRSFILSTVKKDLKEPLEKTKIDDFLFGHDLPETLKSAKTISKSGAELRSSLPTRMPPSTKKNKQPQTRPLNWRAPPPNRRLPQASGVQRSAGPANQRTPTNSSKTSSRPTFRQTRR